MKEPEKLTEHEIELVLELRRTPGRYTVERLPARVEALNKLLVRYRWLEKQVSGETQHTTDDDQ